MDVFEQLRSKLCAIMEDDGFGNEPISVRVKALKPEEAIGNPEDRDYPIIKGRERMMEADFKGSKGQAFTDMYGEFSGTLAEVGAMKLENNYRRAVFLATLNAVARHLGIVQNTVHCKDDQPPECAKELVSYMRENFGSPRVAVVGLQPRMVEALAKAFEVKVTDMDSDNVGQRKFGVSIEGPEETAGNIAWCDVALVTGSTFTNNSVRELLVNKPTVFYGVTVAAPAHFLNLRRFCPRGT